MFYINPVLIYKQLVIWGTAGQMENSTLMALRLIFFRLLQTSKILQSLSLILSSNSKVLWFDGWWLRSLSTRHSGCGTSTPNPLLLIICHLLSIRSPHAAALAMGARLLEARTSLMFSLYTVPGMTASWSMIKDPKYNDNKNNAVSLAEKIQFVAKWERRRVYGCIKLSFVDLKNVMKGSF